MTESIRNAHSLFLIVSSDLQRTKTTIIIIFIILTDDYHVKLFVDSYSWFNGVNVC